MSSISSAGAPLGQIHAPLQISSAGRDVVASGTVISADNRNLEFQLAHLRIVFSFMADSGATRMESVANSSSALTLSLYNFNNAIGAGTTAPVEIGNLGGRRLSLSFMIYAMNPDSTKTVHYTFMLGESK
jgi:hypothetical protein